MVGWRCGRDRFIGLVGPLLSESTWYYWLIHCYLNQHSITIWLEPQKLMCETQRINARKEAPPYLINYVPTADPCMATTLLLHTPPSNAVLLLSYQAQILHHAIAGSVFWWYTSVTCHGWTSSWGGPPFLSTVSPTQSGARRGSQRCSTPTHWELWPAPAVHASFWTFGHTLIRSLPQRSDNSKWWLRWILFTCVWLLLPPPACRRFQLLPTPMNLRDGLSSLPLPTWWTASHL